MSRRWFQLSPRPLRTLSGFVAVAAMACFAPAQAESRWGHAQRDGGATASSRVSFRVVIPETIALSVLGDSALAGSNAPTVGGLGFQVDATAGDVHLLETGQDGVGHESERWRGRAHSEQIELSRSAATVTVLSP